MMMKDEEKENCLPKKKLLTEEFDFIESTFCVNCAFSSIIRRHAHTFFVVCLSSFIDPKAVKIDLSSDDKEENSREKKLNIQ